MSDAPSPSAPDATPAGAGDEADVEGRLRRRVLWTFPSGLYLLGSRHGEERNLMTINWVTQVALEPKLVGVSVETKAVTHRLVADGGTFTVNLLRREDRAVVRKFVRPATWDPELRTLNGAPVTAAVTDTPILASAAAWVDCRVTSSLACGSHTFFVGQVVAAGFGGPEGAEVLRMEDTRMNYGG